MSAEGGSLGAVVTVVVAGGLLAFLVAVLGVMLVRLRREGTLATVLVHVVFLPERRRSVLYLITALAVFFVVSGADAALQSLGVVGGLVQDVVVSVTYVGGALALLWLMWIALRPPEISPARRDELRRASQEFLMLAFAPVDVRDGLGAGAE